MDGVTNVRVECDNVVVVLEIPLGATLEETIELMTQALRGAGFYFDGQLDLVDGDHDTYNSSDDS